MKKFIWKQTKLFQSLPVGNNSCGIDLLPGTLINRELGKHSDKTGHYSIVSVKVKEAFHVGFVKTCFLKIIESKNILYVVKDCILFSKPDYESEILRNMKVGEGVEVKSSTNEFACVYVRNSNSEIITGHLPLKYASHETEKYTSHDESFYETISTRYKLPIYQFHFKSIGIFRSIFPTRSGCPRQGNVVTKTRGYLEITLDNCVSLEGLSSYSHIWILFVFHKNKISKLKYKIRPPRLDGKKKVGIFATRTPHRINPLGLTVCKIEKIDKRKIYCSGIDLIDHTPVIDIKPYIQNCDRLENTLEPEWVKKRHIEDSNVDIVEFSTEARMALENIKKKMMVEESDDDEENSKEEEEEEMEGEDDSNNNNNNDKKRVISSGDRFFHFFDNEIKEIEEVIIQVIRSDPRPRYMKGNSNRKKEVKEKLYGFKIDRLNVRVLFLDDVKKAIVKEIEDFGNLK